MDGKIVGVGWTKTGRTSLHRALEILGYKTVGCVGNKSKNIARTVRQIMPGYLRMYQAFVDFPWALFYDYIDRCYAGSKFILTVRDPEEWLRSVLTGVTTPSRMWAWIHKGIRCVPENPMYCMFQYMAHNRGVAGYFAHRPHDLLIMDVTRGDGWPELCSFLKKDCPTQPYPWLHSQHECNVDDGSQ